MASEVGISAFILRPAEDAKVFYIYSFGDLTGLPHEL